MTIVELRIHWISEMLIVFLNGVCAGISIKSESDVNLCYCVARRSYLDSTSILGKIELIVIRF